MQESVEREHRQMCPQRQLVHRKRRTTEETVDGQKQQKIGNTLNGRWGPKNEQHAKDVYDHAQRGKQQHQAYPSTHGSENKIPYLIIFFINLYIFTCSCKTWLFLLGKIKAKTNQWHGLQKHQWLLQGLRSGLHLTSLMAIPCHPRGFFLSMQNNCVCGGRAMKVMQALSTQYF